jgi:2-hydroxychromene-2-carboxylate isomerase
VELVPFWEPDPLTAAGMQERGAALHYVAMSKAKHLYILSDTKRMAIALGLPMVWPVDINPWWEPAHLAWLKARRLGCATQFYAAVVAARWQRAENISEPRVIAAIGASVGIADGVLAAAVEDPEIRAEGVECLVRAYEDDIFGVPFFRIGRERFWGVDRVQLFIDALTRRSDGAAVAASADRRSVAVAERPDGPGRHYDTDSAGGCG